MHRVLSYQTAMRANTERDVREYVTKRTCVSLILSIAFFTLISGFLLGKFVADRQHHMRNLRDNDIKFIQDLHNTRENLLRSTVDVIEKSVHQKNSTMELNQKIFTKFIDCMKDSHPNYSQDLDVFIEDLIDNRNQRKVECLKTLQTQLTHLASVTSN